MKNNVIIMLMFILNNTFIFITSIKFLLIMFMFYYISPIITPLQFIFRSKILLFTTSQMIFQQIFTKKINPNKLPYIGDLFILIDYIVLKILKLYKN